MKKSDTPRYCAFCGLPLPATFRWQAASPAADVEFCCSGCRSVASVFDAEQEAGNSARALQRLGLAIFFTMNVLVFAMDLWSRDLYPEESFTNPLATSLRELFLWASLLFSVPVVYLLGGPIAQGVWQSLRARIVTTDLLILAGVIAAYSYSLVSVLRGEGHVYFEVGAVVMVFVSMGRFLEAKGKHRTGASLDRLTQLLPTQVRKLEPTGTFVEVARDTLRTGDVVRIVPGERFAVDGIISLGRAMVDQQIVTGESVAVEKSVGDRVFSGTLNLDGDLRVEVTAADGQETLSRIVDMVRAARSVKGRHERLADRIGIVDETGRIIWGDELMILLSRTILKDLPGSTIIAEVKCWQNLFDDIAKHGGVPIMWKAGHSIIKSKMKETNAALAGEMSGHIFFADRFYGFDDATYAGARVLEILSKTDKKLSELLGDLPETFSTPELRVDCPDETKFDVVAKIADEFSKTNEVITIDGARIIFEHGWGLVRASNTQAILVLRFEADSDEHLKAIRSLVEAKVNELVA